MLRTLIFFLCTALFATSCLKNESNNGACPFQPNNNVVPVSEQQALDTYIDTNAIDADKDPSGFYYKIISAGTKTDSLGLCSQIKVNYVGKLINGTVFDQQTDFISQYPLGSFIEELEKRNIFNRKGGQIKLYIPPSFGYANVETKRSADSASNYTRRIYINI